MLYKVFLLLLGFIVLDIAAVPADMLHPDAHVRGQTEMSSPDSGASTEGVVQLQKGITLLDLVNAVSEINGEVYVIDGSVKPAEINIVTPEGGLTKEDLASLFGTILKVNGLAVIETNGINKIVNSGDAIHNATPVKTGRGK